MIQALRDFFYKYYVVPGYDWVDTLTYGLLLGLAVFYLLPRLKSLGFRIDRGFCFSLLPYIIFGATTRELVDRGLGWYAGHSVYPQNFYLVSPTIYVTMFLLTLTCLLVSLKAGSILNRDYRLFFAGLGSILMLYNLILIAGNIIQPIVLAWVLLAFAGSILAAYIIIRILKLNYVFHELNYLIVAAHLFDASTTFIGVDFLGHIEQHVVPTIFINYLGTAFVMYPLKLLVLMPALYYIDRDLGDDVFTRRMLKIVVLVLGMGPGTRNLTLMLLG